MENIMPKGTVKWFNARKGYGFITEEGSDKDVFLHVTELENSKLRVLKENQRLSFDIIEENKKLKAVNLKKA